MREPVDRERMPEGVAHDDRAREQRQELTTADMANPNRTADQETNARNVTELRPGQSGSQSGPMESHAERTPLLGTDEAGKFQSRWTSIQAEFVDDPRHAVESADHLVAEAIQRLAQIFADQRAQLEGQWDRGDNISTEDLRVALQHYRSFFQRLLAA